MFLSQYRPGKGDKGQAAAQAVGTRDHCLMSGCFKTVLESRSHEPGLWTYVCGADAYPLSQPLSLRVAGGGRFEQLTLPSGQRRVDFTIIRTFFHDWDMLLS